MAWKGCIFLALLTKFAYAINLTVSSTGGNASTPLMYGLMFEDISHSGDGGIYAELIQNRAFQGSVPFPSTLKPWQAVGGAALTLENISPLSSSLPYYIKVAPSANSLEKIGLLNPGWWGIDVQPQKYSGSFWSLGAYSGNFTLKLQSDLTGQVFVSTDICSVSVADKWVEHNFELEPTMAAPNSNNSFVLEYESRAGALNFNLISLFPPTYKNTPNGNRPELMEALKALNPSFLRIPGGNNLEGDEYHIRWKWNETIGPITGRPGRPGTWNYQNTDGLGLIEYFNWCRDLEVEPLFAVWSGLYLVEGDFLSPEELKPYVQDTLDELEFLLGPATSTFGSKRAALGYSEPFQLKYLEIGNEDNLNGGYKSYAEYRFKMFFDAINPLYPDLVLVSSAQDASAVAPGSAIDYHIYSRPDDFVERFNYFDNWNRSHKVFGGEYANVQYNLAGQPGAGTNWSAPKIQFPIWSGAVSEAVWSIGFERNGDVGIGMSYAPTLQNLNSYQWSPDLISFTADPCQTVLSTSYRAIELLSAHRYNATVPVVSDTGFGPAYWVAGISEPGKYTFKTAIYNSTSDVPFQIKFDGITVGQTANLTVLNAPDGLSSNLLVDGEVVDIVSRTELILTAGTNGIFEFVLKNYDIAVLIT